MSVIGGSIGAVTNRILVASDRYDEACWLLVDVGVWIEGA